MAGWRGVTDGECPAQRVARTRLSAMHESSRLRRDRRILSLGEIRIRISR